MPTEVGKDHEPPRRQVFLSKSAADGIITISKTKHPNEAVLILQGKFEGKKNRILVNSLVIPPFSISGPYYSGFPVYQLPFDGSYIGMAHSHPGPSNKPSLEDLNHFYGYVSVIICHPYEDKDIAAYDRGGRALDVKITDSP
jgi:proteasome lid subunit RPN8/RPN11